MAEFADAIDAAQSETFRMNFRMAILRSSRFHRQQLTGGVAGSPIAPNPNQYTLNLTGNAELAMLWIDLCIDRFLLTDWLHPPRPVRRTNNNKWSPTRPNPFRKPNRTTTQFTINPRKKRPFQ